MPPRPHQRPHGNIKFFIFLGVWASQEPMVSVTLSHCYVVTLSLRFSLPTLPLQPLDFVWHLYTTCDSFLHHLTNSSSMSTSTILGQEVAECVLEVVHVRAGYILGIMFVLLIKKYYVLSYFNLIYFILFLFIFLILFCFISSYFFFFYFILFYGKREGKMKRKITLKK